MITRIHEDRIERAEEALRLEERKIAALREIANQLSLIAARLPDPAPTTPAMLRPITSR